MEMYITICSGSGSVSRIAYRLFKVRKPIPNAELNGLRGMLQAGPFLRGCEIRNEVYSISNALRNCEMENGDRPPPLQGLVL